MNASNGPAHRAGTRGTSTGTVRLYAGLLVVLAVATGLVPAGPAPSRLGEALAGDAVVVPKGSAILLVDSGGLGPGATLVASLERVFESTGVITDTRWMHHRAFVPSPDPTVLLRAAGGRLRAVVLVVGGLDWFPGVDPVRPSGSVAQRIQRDLDPALVVEEIARWRLAADRVGASLLLATAPLGVGARIEVPETLELEELVRAAGCALDLAGSFRAREDREEFVDGFDTLNDLGRQALVRHVYDEVVARPGLLPARDPAEEAARREARALNALLAGDHEAFQTAAQAALRGEAASPEHAVRRAALSLLVESPARAAERWAALPATPDFVGPTGHLFGRWLAGHEEDVDLARDPFESALTRWLGALGLAADVQRSDEDRAAALLVARARLDEVSVLAPHRLETWIARQVVAGLEQPPRRVRGEALADLSSLDRDLLSMDLAQRLLDEGPTALRWLPALLAASVPRQGMTPTGPGLHDALRRARLIGPGAGLRRLRMQGESSTLPAEWSRLLAESVR